jgi:hypothetical protein
MPDRKPDSSLTPLALSVLRKLGIEMPDKVNVNAPRPPKRENFPSNMEEIWLGDATTKPLGVHFPPEREGRVPTLTGLSPNIRAAAEEALRRWPYAAAQVDDIRLDGKNLLSDSAAEYFSKDNSIRFNPDQEAFDRETLLSLMGHELSHAGSMRSDPTVSQSKERYIKPWDKFRQIFTGDGREALGEDASYAVQTQVMLRLAQENKAIADAAAKKAAERRKKQQQR